MSGGRQPGMTEWFGFETASAIRSVKILYNLPFKLSYIIPKFTATKNYTTSFGQIQLSG
jgi:hypothetical protein